MSDDIKSAATTPQHPKPAINRDVAFLYEGFNHGKLLVQQCSSCSALRHPPAPFCPKCQCGDWGTIEASGKGVLHSYTVHYHPPIPPWSTPHAIGLADMEEGFRFLAAIQGAGAEDLGIGQPVTTGYFEAGEGTHLPYFSIGQDR